MALMCDAVLPGCRSEVGGALLVMLKVFSDGDVFMSDPAELMRV